MPLPRARVLSADALLVDACYHAAAAIQNNDARAQRRAQPCRDIFNAFRLHVAFAPFQPFFTTPTLLMLFRCHFTIFIFRYLLRYAARHIISPLMLILPLHACYAFSLCCHMIIFAITSFCR